MLTRNEAAAVRTATTAVRREVDALDVRMREDVATLKHEYVCCSALGITLVPLIMHIKHSDGAGQQEK